MSALERAVSHPSPVEGLGARSPVAGLRRRSIGFLDVLSQSVSAVAPSAAATTIPLMVAAVAGKSSVLAVAAAMILCLLVASTVNQFARRMSAAGSLYTFVSKGLGAGASFVAGLAMVIGYGFIAMFSLAGAGFYLATLASHFWPGASESGLLVSLLVALMGLLTFFVLARGVRLSTRVTLLVETGSVGIILVLISALLTRQGPQLDWGLIVPRDTDLGDFVIGAVLAITAFVGFESAASLGVEARRPFANIPRAIFGTVVASGLLYIVATYSQLVGFSFLGRSIDSSSSPVNDLATAYGVEWAGLLLDASIAASFLACALASGTALVRVLFSMGREGLLPASFGSTHSRFSTPFFAILVAVPILTAVPVVAIALGSGVRGAMAFLIVTAAAAFVTAYILVCAAVPVFLWRIGELTVWPVARAVAAALLLSGALITYLLAESGTEYSSGVVAFLLLMSLGTLTYAAWTKRHPRRRHTIGLYDEPTGADVLGGIHDPSEVR
jgi:amino acid transporter